LSPRANLQSVLIGAHNLEPAILLRQRHARLTIFARLTVANRIGTVDLGIIQRPVLIGINAKFKFHPAGWTLAGNSRSQYAGQAARGEGPLLTGCFL
jgi:hypothetical protein